MAPYVLVLTTGEMPQPMSSVQPLPAAVVMVTIPPTLRLATSAKIMLASPAPRPAPPATPATLSPHPQSTTVSVMIATPTPPPTVHSESGHAVGEVPSAAMAPAQAVTLTTLMPMFTALSAVTPPIPWRYCPPILPRRNLARYAHTVMAR